jgi:hypothetical protein
MIDLPGDWIATQEAMAQMVCQIGVLSELLMMKMNNSQPRERVKVLT